MGPQQHTVQRVDHPGGSRTSRSARIRVSGKRTHPHCRRAVRVVLSTTHWRQGLPLTLPQRIGQRSIAPPTSENDQHPRCFSPRWLIHCCHPTPTHAERPESASDAGHALLRTESARKSCKNQDCRTLQSAMKSFSTAGAMRVSQNSASSGPRTRSRLRVAGMSDSAANRWDRIEQGQQLGDTVAFAAGQQNRDRGAVPDGDQVVFRPGPASVDRRGAHVLPPI